MSFCLGNLSVEEMERRAGVKLPQQLRDYMESRRQNEASNVRPGKWHCFDIPFLLVCGDMETATKIYEHLKGLDFQDFLQISINNENTKKGGDKA